MSGAGALSRGAGLRHGDCGDHRGACAIDDRRWSTAADGLPVIERVATGDTGRVGIRHYEGEGDTAKLPGTASGRIQGQTFKGMDRNTDPSAPVSNENGIEPEWADPDGGAPAR